MRVMLSIGYLSGGGAERIVSIWASYLAENGYDTMILLSARDNSEYAVSPRVRICSVAEDKNQYLSMPYLKRIITKRNYIKQFKPDAMINFLPRGQIRMLIYAFGIKARRIETIRINPWRAELSKPAVLLWKLCFLKSNSIIVQTEDQKDFFGKICRDKCVVVRNTLGNAFLSTERSRPYDTPKKFISTGRLCPQKNFPMLINAFAIFSREYNNVILEIYGMGSKEYTEELTDLINKLGMNDTIKLMGRTENIPEVLVNSDVFILSSDYEGLPNSLAEAMSVGLVCISTDCKTGPKDLITNGQNGLLTKTGDVQSMAECLEKVMKMTHEELTQMAQQAKESVRKLCDETENMERLKKTLGGTRCI